MTYINIKKIINDLIDFISDTTYYPRRPLRNINKYDLIDIYRILHLTAEYAFSSCVHGTFIKVDHILGINVLTDLKEFTGHDFE